MKTPTVDTPSPGYADMMAKWKIIDDLYDGTASMLAAGTMYLPQRPGEADATYKERLENSTLLNAVRWAVKTLSSKPFGKPLQIGAETSPELSDFIWDVDGTGRPLQQFAHSFFAEALKYGLNHLLVEYPAVGEMLTVAQEHELAIRPYFVSISPKSLFAWKFERVGGVERLVQIRLRETAKVPGEWGDVEVEQIRVINLDNIQLYRKAADSTEWVLHLETPLQTPFTQIPLVTFYTEQCGQMCACPPLEDLAYLNLKHWRKQSNLDYIESAQFPILFGKNLTVHSEADGAWDGTLPLGVMMMVHSTMDNATLEIIEPSGASIDKLRSSIQQLEDQMAALSSQLLAKRPGNETATGRAIDSAESISDLQAMARNLEDALETALEYAATWMNVAEPNADVELYREFATVLSADDITQLLKARESNQLSHETFILEAKRRGFLSESVDATSETAKLTSEKSLNSPNAGEL